MAFIKKASKEGFCDMIELRPWINVNPYPAVCICFSFLDVYRPTCVQPGYSEMKLIPKSTVTGFPEM